MINICTLGYSIDKYMHYYDHLEKESSRYVTKLDNFVSYSLSLKSDQMKMMDGNSPNNNTPV